MFMVLNLLPILPLDGGRILVSLLPRRAAGAVCAARAVRLPLLAGALLLTNVAQLRAAAAGRRARDALIRAIVL